MATGELCRDTSCENCRGLGYYGDNGPGIIGNNEYVPCEGNLKRNSGRGKNMNCEFCNNVESKTKVFKLFGTLFCVDCAQGLFDGVERVAKSVTGKDYDINVALRQEIAQLKIALKDAINSDKGVVPDSALKFCKSMTSQ